MLGITKFDKEAVFNGEYNDFNRVEISLSSHIGAPSIPCVKDGDIVSEGEIIANQGSGLSLPQHASISGRVTLGINKIIIDRIR
jgi:Na+-translocating ferredoxin:NAD+ oxidoreductase RnfC subunit